MQWNKLVPELIVKDLHKSYQFWVELLGFTVMYQRKEEQFIYLDLDGVQFMLEQQQEGQWLTAQLDYPLGRGINFQIEVEQLDEILSRLTLAQWSLFSELEECWYRADDVEHGQKQFLVQDPDGYLLRIVEVLGERPI
ncbi:MAG: VOC family protein [Pseudomonadota bacterium]|jgi:catechol 2,3-dioxygenase-like lactoylglutathione lyase family enzyme|uniref:Bleomycin resistance protein n=1 Tax=Acinetobacter bereziniae TaxID=106648 RepID=A0A8I1AJI5_ACIBZ|nr:MULTISPECIES: VOC family protein [Acinetobacter]MEC8123871.1 VOC family protein [Pseudomonadota bacterium]MBJ9949989.1 VOC family protein [Acinetobacter bereziniae]MDA3442780.1 VOC family protein [Acinetobacter bereziniae]QQC82919.1 VOC family protein [Acinetobacter bereziniae]UUN96064.1 VOC family protein [Acinetobacter bereziniae]